MSGHSIGENLTESLDEMQYDIAGNLIDELEKVADWLPKVPRRKDNE